MTATDGAQLDLLGGIVVTQARPVFPQVVTRVDVVLPARASRGVAHEQGTLLAPTDTYDRHGVQWHPASLDDANALLRRAHYLGPTSSGGRCVFGGFLASGRLVAVQVWRAPTARNLPADGTWLELSRWCLTPDAGPNAGSRQHRAAVRHLSAGFPEVTTLVSYSDPSAGHTGALYRACNWRWAPTWLRLRPPPTGNGRWATGEEVQAVKDRWVFDVRRDETRSSVLMVGDGSAIRAWLRSAGPDEIARGVRSMAPDLSAACRAVA